MNSNKSQKITACAFIHRNGKMLGVQRAAHKKFLPNKWEIVGGHIEFGESIEEGLLREIKEELGIEIEIEHLFYAFTYLKDESTHSIEVVYLARPKSNQEISLDPDALQKYKWLSKNEALELYDSNNSEYPAIIKGFELVEIQ